MIVAARRSPRAVRVRRRGWPLARLPAGATRSHRSTSALFVLHSADPKLADIGFVWMPLPTLLNLPWAALYPVWPGRRLPSGAASALRARPCARGRGGHPAASPAGRLGLPAGSAASFALLVSLQPHAVPLRGHRHGRGRRRAVPDRRGVLPHAVLAHRAALVDRRRRRIALALAVASLYEAVPYGAAVFAAMAAGMLWSSERRPSEPQGRGRAIEGARTRPAHPRPSSSGLLWIGANAVIMSDPLFFLNGAYGYSSYQADAFTSGGARGGRADRGGRRAARAAPVAVPDPARVRAPGARAGRSPAPHRERVAHRRRTQRHDPPDHADGAARIADGLPALRHLPALRRRRLGVI